MRLVPPALCVAAVLPGALACLEETTHRELPSESVPEIPSAAGLGSATPDCGDVASGVAPAGALERADGWAATVTDEREGTTGGAGGRVVLARTLDELVEYAESTEPLVIQVCGAIGTRTERVNLGSDKTLVGVGVRPTLLLSLDIDRVHNVVVRDIFIQGSVATDGGDGPDAISIRRSHHVWVDHVDVSDGADGNLDVTHESNYVTVSWSRFWYPDPGRSHRFSTLIGSSDSQTTDTGLLKVTLHHNWWADNVTERMPRARYGDVHVYNNYYSSFGNNYCIRSGVSARLLVEGNHFHSVSDPMVLDASGQVVQRDNVFEFARGTRASSGAGFEPPYEYALDPSSEVRERVVGGAGPRR